MHNWQCYDELTVQVRSAPPEVAIVLGSGLSGVADGCETSCRVPFSDVPELAAPSVPGHRGFLQLGSWAGRRVLVFEGRLHRYEGHSWEAVTAPVRIAHSLGARVLLLTNAAGGIHDALVPGSLMAVRDQIEWTWPYCWRRPGLGEMGSNRPSPYSPRLLRLLGQAAEARGITLNTGVYAAVTGPCYETPAEIRALWVWGADAVGMSTAREIQTGHDLGMECAAVCCITNRAAGLASAPINHEEVLHTAAAQSERVTRLLEAFLQLVPG
jgi:purine-nucleoside phosphorylase